MKSAYVSKEQFQPLETASTLSLNSLITHSVIHGQERGLTTPAREHFEAYGQVVHGDCSIDLTSTGARSGVSLYVHLPLSSIFSLRIIPRLSSRMASLEPSLLLRASSFQRTLCKTPSFPCSETSLQTLDIKSSAKSSLICGGAED